MKTKGGKIVQEKKNYRHELKFSISHTDYLAMRNRLRCIMTADPHASKDGVYRIRSLYFDNYEDKALREKTEGIQKREKFRIRYYNDDHSYITLEKKMKINDLCLKYDARITEEECEKLLSGDRSFMRNHESDLVKELYAKMSYQRLTPRVIVSYLREPYIYRPGNVRVTFDSQIRTSLYNSDFLADTVYDISATDSPGDMILEVKYDAFMPEVIQDLIQLNYINQQAFSKYGACRRYG